MVSEYEVSDSGAETNWAIISAENEMAATEQYWNLHYGPTYVGERILAVRLKAGGRTNYFTYYNNL